MLQEAPHHRGDADVLGQTRDARAQRADAAHDQVDLHAGAAGFIQGLDDALFQQRIQLGDDACLAAGLGGFGLALDGLQQRAVQPEGRLQQRLQAAGGTQAGQAAEDLVHVGADFLVGGEEPEVLIQACRARVVVAGAQVGIASQPFGLASQHQGQFGVGLVTHHAIDHVHAHFFQLGGPVDVGLFVEAGHQLQHDGDFLAGAGGFHQRFHQHRVGAGAVDGLLDGHDLRVACGAAQEVLHRIEGFVGVVQQHVAGGNHAEQVVLLQGGGLAGGERREEQVGALDQLDDLGIASQVDRAVDPVAVLFVQVEFLAQALGHFGADVGGHFQPHAMAPGALTQLVAEGAAQVGHFFLVHEQVAVAGEAERALRADGESGEQLAHEALDDGRQQHDAVRHAGHFGRHLEGDGQHARRLHDGQARAAAEGVAAVQLHGEVECLAGDARERMGRVQGDGGEQRLDLAHEDLVGPVAQGVVPLGGKEDLHALGFQRRQDVAAQHLVLALDQLAGANGQRGDAGACRGRQRGVASGDFLQLGHADLEQLVEIAGDDGDVAQPLQQGGVGGFGQRQHAAVEGDDALLAVQRRGQGGSGGVVHAGSSGLPPV